MMQAKNIWVIQTAFVGDNVLCLPLLKEICQNFPDANIQYITTKIGAELLEIAKGVGLANFAGRLFAKRLDKRGKDSGLGGLFRFARELKKEAAPEIVFCVQRSFRSGLLSFISGAKCRVGFSSGSASLFYTHIARRIWESRQHEIEKNLDLLRTLGFEVPDWAQPDQKSLLGTRKSNEVEKFRKVGISIGSPWPSKMWPSEHVVSLAKTLTSKGMDVYLLGDAHSAQLGEEITREIGSPLVQNYVGKTTLAEWVTKISTLDILISPDSAAVHVASDLGVPVIGLFGPTVPEFGFAPWRKSSLVLGLKNLPCRPCHIHGLKVCPLKHHRCMKDLGPKRVLDFMDRILPELRV